MTIGLVSIKTTKKSNFSQGQLHWLTTGSYKVNWPTIHFLIHVHWIEVSTRLFRAMRSFEWVSEWGWSGSEPYLLDSIIKFETQLDSKLSLLPGSWQILCTKKLTCIDNFGKYLIALANHRRLIIQLAQIDTS